MLLPAEIVPFVEVFPMESVFPKPTTSLPLVNVNVPRMVASVVMFTLLLMLLLLIVTFPKVELDDPSIDWLADPIKLNVDATSATSVPLLLKSSPTFTITPDATVKVAPDKIVKESVAKVPAEMVGWFTTHVPEIGITTPSKLDGATVATV